MKMELCKWITIGICCIAASACDSLRGSPEEELVGRIKFVIVDRVATIPYLVHEGEAILLMPSDDVSFVGISDPVAGDGITFWDHRFHSASTYRVTGSFGKEIEDQYKIVTMPTRRFDVDSFELVKDGTSDCVSYMAVSVPPPSDGSGWVPVLPESIENQKGIFVQNGTIRCTVVKRQTPVGPRLTMSFRSIGSLNINESIPWAQADAKEGGREDNDAPEGVWSERQPELPTLGSDERIATLQREIVELDQQIETIQREIALEEEYLKSLPSGDPREHAMRQDIIEAKKVQLKSKEARRELQQQRLYAAEARLKDESETAVGRKQ